ncbi:MAG: hypothetical protein KAT68_15725 [Bacteroidales bacterium]|nr:hypothetical protein [Bacteroidales bacterium]
MKINNNIGKLTLVILGIIIFQTSFCQENYLPGYIITLKGDTLQGFIDYRNWEKNPNKIYFKDNIRQFSFTPNEIKLFSVQDEVYVSAIVKTEVSPNKTIYLEFASELKTKFDTIFLQTMIQGVKSLYYYKNSNGKENFYIKQNMEYDLLVYKKYLKKQKGKNVITENKKYTGQLMLYLHDCPSIQSKLRNTEYNQKSMENLFLFYYDYTQSKIEFQKKTEKISTEIGVLTGVSLTSLEFRSKYYYTYLVNADYSQSVNFSTGLFFNVILLRNQGKWSICNELIFTSYKVEGRYNYFENENNYSIINTEFEYSYLKMNNMGRFKYPIGSLFVYLNAGISNGFAISETNYEKIESKVYSIEKIGEGKVMDDTRKYEQGYILGLGTKFKKYSFEIRYEKGNGMSEYTCLNSLTVRYYFLFGYRF